jgi:hypothetical protein
MATLLTTQDPCLDHLSTCVGTQDDAPDTITKLGPPTTQPRHAKNSYDAARNAVATAFARIVAERHPGTTWLPIERPRGNDGLVVPAGKIVRLLPGPTDINASAGVRHPTAPAAHERAPYKHSADPGA